MTKMGPSLNFIRRKGGRGGLTKSIRLLFWGHHYFVKMHTWGEGEGQIFGLFKRVYFMDDPNTKMSGRRLRLDYAVIEQNINI